MSQSTEINELMTALAKAQGSMKPALKDSTNPHFKSRYADLASVWEACREALSTNQIAVTQTCHSDGDKQFLVTTLAHSSGQWIKSSMLLPIQKAGSQELGSCLSYCRRYSLAAMVGVYQDDDDGERAEQPVRNKQETKKEEPTKPATLTSDNIKTLEPMFAADPEAAAAMPDWRTKPIAAYPMLIKKLQDRAEERKKEETVDE